MDSEVGLGTTFKIYLPRIDDLTKTRVRDAAREMVRGNETILLVEDEQSVREMALKLLKHIGYKVLCASNAGEALAQSQSHEGHIDLLMTDVVMPGINGRELAERPHRLRPEMKVLFTSGYTEDVIVLRSVLDANVSFIAKPYSLHAVAKKIREILHKEAR